MMHEKEKHMNTVWRQTLDLVGHSSQRAYPREKATREVLHHTIEVNMRYPVVTFPSRKLSYKFMAAEAYWILSGSNRVEDIEPYNTQIAKFSDDGETFFGAYGPKVVAQLDYIVDCFRHDKWTRQAGLVTWRENPPLSHDIPCTITLFVNVRGGRLNLHVFMRSSDVWLGLPYDVFNFSMIGMALCARINPLHHSLRPFCTPGSLFLTAMSSHLYAINEADAYVCLAQDTPAVTKPIPEFLYQDEPALMNRLKQLRTSTKVDPLRWWL